MLVNPDKMDKSVIVRQKSKKSIKSKSKKEQKGTGSNAFQSELNHRLSKKKTHRSKSKKPTRFLIWYTFLLIKSLIFDQKCFKKCCKFYSCKQQSDYMFKQLEEELIGI
jgi:hypothetical protein